MKRTILAILLATTAPVAFATGNGHKPQNANSHSNANAVSHSKSHAESTAVGVGVGLGGSATATGGQGWGIGGTASANPSAAGGTASANPTAVGTVSQGVNIVYPKEQTITHQGRQIIENVPNVGLANMWPSATCMGTSTVGGSGVGFGFGVGTSWRDEECNKRETARAFQAFGYTKAALQVLCSQEAAKVADECKQFQKEEPAPAKSAATDVFGPQY